MVIGWAEYKGDAANRLRDTSSAWRRVEVTQQQPQLPCLLIPQPAHAVLAGHLAEGLVAAAFGELPPEIKQAITMHDTGWAMSDAAQLQRLRSGSSASQRAIPLSFLSSSSQEIAEAWTASIQTVERISTVSGLIVSRHFALLAMSGGQEHRGFVAAEQARQRKLASSAGVGEEDLKRWTAALGFCDLASLYLIIGLKLETEFPLAHPASTEAQTAPRAMLRFEQNRLHWSPAIFSAGSRFELEGLKHPVPPQGPRGEKLVWECL